MATSGRRADDFAIRMSAHLRALHLLQHIGRSLVTSDESHASPVAVAASADLPLKELFNFGRLRYDRINKVWYALFVLYFPMGYAPTSALHARGPP